MPGVKAILTADDLPAPADSLTDNGTVIKASKWGERGLTMEPLYQGEPILAVAAVDELTAAEAIEKIQIDFEPLPFVVDPLDTLRPGGPNPRTDGNVWVGPRQAGNPAPPAVTELKWTEADFAEAKARPSADGQDARRMVVWRCRRRLQERRAGSGRNIRHARHQPPDAWRPAARWLTGRTARSTFTPARRAPPKPLPAIARWLNIDRRQSRLHQRIHRRRIRQQDHRRRHR